MEGMHGGVRVLFSYEFETRPMAGDLVSLPAEAVKLLGGKVTYGKVVGLLHTGYDTSVVLKDFF